MVKLKTQKGITLIALIITIVVLLILAVVAIGTAQESNIVGYAQNASEKYELAKDNEISLLKQYENKIEEVISGADEYPKVYRTDMDSQKTYWIQTGEKEGVVAIVQDETILSWKNMEIKEESNLKNITGLSEANIIDNGCKYSKVVIGDGPGLVYVDNINKWIFLVYTLETNGGGIAEVRIELDRIAEEDTSLTQEQINAYIAAAVD